MARIRSKSISKYLAEIGESLAPNSTDTNNKVLARRIWDWWRTAKHNDMPKVVDSAYRLSEAIDGKPVQANINMDVSESQMPEISTEDLERIRAMAKDMKDGQEKP